MTPTRRQFVAALVLPLVAGVGCALRAARQPKGLVEGYVFHRGYRFGRADLRSPNHPVMALRWQNPLGPKPSLIVVSKARTDHRGKFHFDLPPGFYYFQAVGGPWKVEHVTPERPVWVNLFKYYR